MARTRDSWFKFEIEAWLEDTRHMSLEQRGAYIDAIVLQMKYQRPLNDDYKWLSHALHISERKARSIVESLIDLTVIVRTDEGLTNPRAAIELESRLAQRRAKSDSALARERAKRENYENPSKNNDDPATEKHNIREEERREKNKTLGQTDGSTAGQMDLLGGEKIAPETKAKPRPRPTDKQFTDFWDAYPRRVKKAEARKKFLLLTPSDADTAIEGARAYAREVALEGRDPSMVMHPTRYLNQRVFEDISDASCWTEPDPVDGKAWGFWRADPAWKTFSARAWRDALDRAKPNGTWPWWNLGPPPGHPECLVHPDVLTERKLVEIYQGKITHD